MILSDAEVDPIGTVAASRKGERRIQVAVLTMPTGSPAVRLATHADGHVVTIRLRAGHLATLMLMLARAGGTAWPDEWHLPNFGATTPHPRRERVLLTDEDETAPARETRSARRQEPARRRARADGYEQRVPGVPRGKVAP